VQSVSTKPHSTPNPRSRRWITLVLSALVLCSAAYYFRTVATGELDRKLLAKLSDDQVAQRAGQQKPEFEAVMEWAKRLEVAGKTEEARRVYGRAVELRSTEVRAWSGWSRATYSSGDWGESERILDHAIPLWPKNPDLLLVRAALYASTGRSRAAREDLQVALQSLPDNAPAWQSLGDLQFEAEDFKGAEASYGKAMRLAPSTYLNFRHGACLTRVGKPKDALKEINAALTQDPSDVEARYYLGEALAATGTDDERAQALREFNRAVTFSPDKARPWVRVAEIWMREGNYGDAGQALERAVDSNPSNLEAVRKLVEVYKKDGRHAEADRFERELKRLEKLEQRKQALEVELEAGRNVSANLAKHARLNYAFGDLKGAHDDMIGAVNLEPKNATFRKDLKELEVIMKRRPSPFGGGMAEPR
jgi:tetratricopeptide (TPR) repeat protein